MHKSHSIRAALTGAIIVASLLSAGHAAAGVKGVESARAKVNAAQSDDDRAVPGQSCGCQEAPGNNDQAASLAQSKPVKHGPGHLKVSSASQAKMQGPHDAHARVAN